ncbi:MAG: NAD(P)/FAD-dependent oxidoreductase [Dehalococcoidia bacterium]|nr:NAD(P)/FAD-dependent oxidoreductase [Dehalococcoidia bacterium]
MNDKQNFDVAIIGAGPAGSYLAWKLAGKGYRVAVIEEHQVIGEPVNCTGIIGIDCFKKFPLGLNSVLRAANSARFYSPSGHDIFLQKEENQAYIVNRGAFDRELAEKAMSAGAAYYTGQRIKNILVEPGGVKLFPSDKATIFEARAAVFASGFNS